MRLFLEQKGLCYYCKCEMNLKEYKDEKPKNNDVTIEHLNPKKSPLRLTPNHNKERRLVAACYSCNHKKGKKYNKELQKK